jgi:hypothetical protein
VKAVSEQAGPTGSSNAADAGSLLAAWRRVLLCEGAGAADEVAARL